MDLWGIAGAVDVAVRLVAFAALLGASVVAGTHWAVRRKKINPFGIWPRWTRRVSDPLLGPIERRLVRSGGNPQDASLWLLGLAVVAGLVLVSVSRWIVDSLLSLTNLHGAGPRYWTWLLFDTAINLLMLAILIRAVSSWFGVSPYGRWMRPIYRVSGWIVDPIRRWIPPTGTIDWSPMAGYLALLLLRMLLTSTLR